MIYDQVCCDLGFDPADVAYDPLDPLALPLPEESDDLDAADD
jgi:hypothetical protein